MLKNTEGQTINVCFSEQKKKKIKKMGKIQMGTLRPAIRLEKYQID